MADENVDEKQIVIQKLYIKDSSFESPNTPEVFRGAEWKPKTDLNLSSSHVPFEDNTHEVTLTVTVEAKDNDNAIFIKLIVSPKEFSPVPMICLSLYLLFMRLLSKSIFSEIGIN